MRFRHPDGSLVHLGYCSNVHPAEDFAGVVGQLRRFAAPVRRALGAPRLGVGLWLAAPLARRLRHGRALLDTLRDELDRLGLEVVTLNGFPYRAFQAPVVKHEVYRPDWSDPARLDYTLDLAHVLARLLPDEATEGSISTLPLGWRGAVDTGAARAALAKATSELAALAATTGRRVRLALEPEPGCEVETVAQAAAALEGIPPEWAGVCLDTCHLAVVFESMRDVLRSGATIVKAQLSTAARGTAADLAALAEPRFLHQTYERTPAGVAGVDDLGRALAGELPGATEWRVHFHTPVHFGGPATTQDELLAALRGLVGGPAPRTRHLEVETYTWGVLPEEVRPRGPGELVGALAAELSWTRDRLCELGLKEVG